MAFAAIVFVLSGNLAYAQGVLENGGNYAGAISTAGEMDLWTFSAVNGTAVSLRVAEVDPATAAFVPWIRLRDPNGVQVASSFNNLVGAIDAVAHVTGTYTVVVASGDVGNQGTGNYLLTLATAGDFIVPIGDQGGAIGNGANESGTIQRGDLDQWTFTAVKGAMISLRAGQVDPVAAGFVPWIRLRDPNGVEVASSYNNLVAAIDREAQLTGTYRVVIASGDVANQGTGNYLLTLATGPGAFTIPNGDDGGPISNGVNYPGAIHRGDLDQWTFTAVQGAAISLRAGQTDPVSTGFVPWMRLRDPNGVEIASSYNNLVAAIDRAAQLTGTYTVVIATGDVANQGTGSYQLTLATGPQPFTVPDGDQGGPMTNGVSYPGTIHRGDLDQWTFWAVAGAAISITASEQPGASAEFIPWLRLRNPNGVQVASAVNTVAAINHVPNLTGKYTVVVATGDVANSGTGNYILQATGIQSPPLPPAIGSLPNVFTNVNTPIGVPVTLAGGINGPGALGLVGSSSNPTLVPNANLVFSGLGASRLLTITPAGNRTGATTITLFASDGSQTATTSFVLVVGGLPSPGDFDGDKRTEVTVFRPSTGTWYIRNPVTGLNVGLGWGGGGDIPVPGDYDFDGLADMAVFRPSNGTWYIRQSSTGTMVTSLWGGVGDVPVPGDYDADGRTDVAVFRPSNGVWYIRNSATGLDEGLLWGALGDVPVPGDYDADGKTDMAVFRPSSGTWYLRSSTTGALTASVWGGVGDIAVPADYDGDGRTDIAVFRASTGIWYIRNSATGLDEGRLWGGPDDVPVPGDYDADGKIDLAVFRPSTGTWYIRSSINGEMTTVVWGGAGDMPVLARQ